MCVMYYIQVESTFLFRDRLYANMDELYAQVPQEEVDPYGYGDETIYDSICYYRHPEAVRSRVKAVLYV